MTIRPEQHIVLHVTFGRRPWKAWLHDLNATLSATDSRTLWYRDPALIALPIPACSPAGPPVTQSPAPRRDDRDWYWNLLALPHGNPLMVEYTRHCSSLNSIPLTEVTPDILKNAIATGRFDAKALTIECALMGLAEPAGERPFPRRNRTSEDSDTLAALFSARVRRAISSSPVTAHAS